MGTKKKILIIEDNSICASHIKSLFSMFNPDIDICKTGKEAYKNILKKNTI
jgi:DNA-binding response OmpR family regulator